MNIVLIVVLLILALIVLYCAVILIMTARTFKDSYGALNIEEYSTWAHWDYYKDRYKRREVKFNSRGNMLKAYVYEAKTPKGLIVFSHGIWSGPEEYLMLITWFVDHGWNVFSYTYTSYNGSEGKWAKGLPQSPIDLESALTYIENDETLNKLPRVVMGHSWGAYATTAVLNYGHHVDGAVAFSGFSDPVEISVSRAESIIGKAGKTAGWAVDLLDKILFGRESRFLAVDGINFVDVPVLLVHGINDDYIYYDKTSITCHRKEITNPKVEYLDLDNPLQSDHNNYFRSEEATVYNNDIMKKFDKIKKQYPKGVVPQEVRKEFFEKYDKEKLNKPNVELFEKVEKFLEEKVLNVKD